MKTEIIMMDMIRNISFNINKFIIRKIISHDDKKSRLCVRFIAYPDSKIEIIKNIEFDNIVFTISAYSEVFCQFVFYDIIDKKTRYKNSTLSKLEREYFLLTFSDKLD
jgi:hypothetical protein